MFLFLILWNQTRPKFYPLDSTQFRFFANFRQNMSRNSIMSITSNAVAMKKKIVKMILLGPYLNKKRTSPKSSSTFFLLKQQKDINFYKLFISSKYHRLRLSDEWVSSNVFEKGHFQSKQLYSYAAFGLLKWKVNSREIPDFLSCLIEQQS